MDEKQYLVELDRSKKKILESKAPRKLVVSGPGTGKTTFFGEAISYYGGKKDDYLILTFINNLVDELRRDLGDIAKIYTFHGFCHFLLRKDDNLRSGLRDGFKYYPPLIELIKSDWKIFFQKEPPKFSKLMRNVTDTDELKFFLVRGNYYNAVGYDDSVFRVYKSLSRGKILKEEYKLIIVDEYQDFNLLETSVLLRAIELSSALFVGDDDQALYCELRESNPKFLRQLFNEEDFENFELPFCLRCPSAVITVFNRIVRIAKENGFLSERIDKRFIFFPPFKGEDSKNYPIVRLVLSSVQKKTPASNNYFGRYIAQEVKKIPDKEIKQSREEQFPTVLIIGPRYYFEIIGEELKREGYDYKTREEEPSLRVNIDEGFRILSEDRCSNLGWRIVLEKTKPAFYSEIIPTSVSKEKKLVSLIPKKFVKKLLADAKSFKEKKQEIIEVVEEIDRTKPTIQLTTFEGAKGLSAQHVFIVGFQNGILPKKSDAISDIEVCKLLVALTRTRKQCTILVTKNFCGKWVDASEFMGWVEGEYVQKREIDKTYWNTRT